MDELISKKAVLELPRMTQEPIKAYGKLEYINVKDVENLPTIPQNDFSKTNEDIIAELKNREALEPLCEAVRKVSEKVVEMVTSEEFVNLLKEEAEPQTAIKHFGAMECPNCGALFYEVPMIETVLENIKAEIHEELYGDISYTDLERIEHIIDKHISGKE